VRYNQNTERQPNHNNPGRNPERSNNSIHSHNTGRRSSHNNLSLGVGNLKERRGKKRTESRMTKSLSHYDEKAAIYKIWRVEQENYLTLQ
jgi:hypothetical protein